LISETVDRGLIHNGLTRFAPSFGSDYEPGSEPAESASALVKRFSNVCPSTAAALSLPAEIAIDAGNEEHWSAEHASILGWLKHLASTDRTIPPLADGGARRVSRGQGRLAGFIERRRRALSARSRG
jgi:hypothetical protein